MQSKIKSQIIKKYSYKYNHIYNPDYNPKYNCNYICNYNTITFIFTESVSVTFIVTKLIRDKITNIHNHTIQIWSRYDKGTLTDIIKKRVIYIIIIITSNTFIDAITNTLKNITEK